MPTYSVHEPRTPPASDQGWDLDVSSRPRLFSYSIKDIYNFRYLLSLFVYRDLVITYKQTILGPLWILLKPLLTTLAFVATFSEILGISTDNVPPLLFYLTGLLCWGLFSEIFTMTSTIFVDNASIFSKVYFPRLIRPLSLVISAFIRTTFQIVIVIVVLIYYIRTGHIQPPSFSIIYVVPLLICIAMLGLGLGLLFSSVTSKYRDLKHLVQFGVQLLMYLTPVIYPMTQVPDAFRTWMQINPLSAPIEAVRSVLLGLPFPSLGALFYSFGMVLIFTILGVAAFNRVEARAMDTI